MNEKEHFFLRTVADLRSCLNAGDPYRLTRASGLLRQLLDNGQSLLAQANAQANGTPRVEIRFAVGSLSPLTPRPPDGFTWRGFGPSRSAKLVRATLDEFLGCQCLVVGREVFSVLEVIKFAANILRGVHMGKPDKAHYSALSSVSKSDVYCTFASGEKAHLALGVIVGIAHTTLAALQPLVNAINQNANRI
jgi:hypothetical protein